MMLPPLAGAMGSRRVLGAGPMPRARGDRSRPRKPGPASGVASRDPLASALGCPPFPRPMPAIVVEQLVKTFHAGRVRALDGVTLTLDPGEAVGHLGPDGARQDKVVGRPVGFPRA